MNINILSSENSMKSGQINKEEEELHSREENKNYIGNNQSLKTDSFYPQSSNISNMNLKSD